MKRPPPCFGSAQGAAGTLEVARTAVRRPCDLTVEVNGTHGTLVFDNARLNELRYGSDGDDPGLYGMRTIRAEHASHPFAAHWWPIGQGVGVWRELRESGCRVVGILAGGTMVTGPQAGSTSAGGLRSNGTFYPAAGMGQGFRGRRPHRARNGLSQRPVDA